MFCTLVLPGLGSGPLWGLLVNKYATLCQSYWWRNLLYIHNHFPFDQMVSYSVVYILSVKVTSVTCFKYTSNGCDNLLLCHQCTRFLKPNKMSNELYIPFYCLTTYWGSIDQYKIPIVFTLAINTK